MKHICGTAQENGVYDFRMIPSKLKNGDRVQIVAPSCSLSSIAWMTDAFLDRAKKRFAVWGIEVTEGKHIRERDAFDSSSIASRLEDLHDAFADRRVKAMIAIRGGFAANQLLRHLDYDLIRKNPKILCGFSDITALSNAIYAKTGLMGYSGPNFYHYGFEKGMEYSIDGFRRCALEGAPFAVEPAVQWTNDRASLEQSAPAFEPNEGYWIVHAGTAEGRLLGGNLCTLQLLHGTEFMPDLRDSVLFLEDDRTATPATFDRDLQSLIHQPGFDGVRGIVIGRFEKPSAMTRALLTQIIDAKEELRHLPAIANADFGHTHPMITFPIGGAVRIEAGAGARITIMEH